MQVIDTSMDMPQSCDKCEKTNCKGALVPWGDIKFPLSKSGDNFMNARLPDCPLKEVNNKSVLEDIKEELIQSCKGYPLKAKAFEENTNIIALPISEITKIMDKYIKE